MASSPQSPNNQLATNMSVIQNNMNDHAFQVFLKSQMVNSVPTNNIHQQIDNRLKLRNEPLIERRGVVGSNVQMPQTISLAQRLFNARHIGIAREITTLLYGDIVRPTRRVHLDFMAFGQIDDREIVPYYDESDDDEFVNYESATRKGLSPDEFLNIMNPADSNSECAICFEDYTKQANPQIIKLPCDHELCVGCATRTFEEYTTCPICRKDFKSPTNQ